MLKEKDPYIKAHRPEAIKLVTKWQRNASKIQKENTLISQTWKYSRKKSHLFQAGRTSKISPPMKLHAVHDTVWYKTKAWHPGTGRSKAVELKDSSDHEDYNQNNEGKPQDSPCASFQNCPDCSSAAGLQLKVSEVDGDWMCFNTLEGGSSVSSEDSRVMHAKSPDWNMLTLEKAQSDSFRQCTKLH